MSESDREHDFITVKKVCNELNIKPEELSEIIKTSYSSIRKWSADPTLTPEWAKSFFEYLINFKKIEAKNKIFNKALNMIDEARG